MIINAEEARSATRDYKKREYKALQNDADVLVDALMNNREFVQSAVAILEEPINSHIKLLSSIGMSSGTYYPKFLSHKTDNGMMILEGSAFDLFNKYVPMMMHKYKIRQSYVTFMNTDPDTKAKIVPRINCTCLDKLEKRLLRLVRTDLRIAGYKVDGTNIYW